MVNLLRRVAGRFNFDLVWRDYYSPIPDASQVDARDWDVARDLPGVDWRPSFQVAFYESLERGLAEFRANPPPAPFRLPNGSFGTMDSEVLYAVVRTLQPQRIIEIGAGYSTLVISAATIENGRAGAETSFVSYDPYPSPLLQPKPAGLDRIEAAKTQDVALAVFDGLEAGDLLFLDTTHVAKLDSDVVRLLLDVMPRLKPGVTVHLHDIYIPWEYPRLFFEERGYFWNEQYLVHAFLAFNDSYEILLSNHWLARTAPEIVSDGGQDLGDAASLWIRRRST